MEIEINGIIEQYFMPPSWTIPNIVFDFYKEYRYCKTFGVAPMYQKQSKKFISFWLEYENTYNECKRLVDESGSKG